MRQCRNLLRKPEKTKKKSCTQSWKSFRLKNAQKNDELKALQNQLSSFDSKFSKLSEAFVEKKEPTPEERAAATLTDIQKIAGKFAGRKRIFRTRH